MKVKKFISKLQSFKYHIWITKNHFTIYEGDINEFIGIYAGSDLFNKKIKSFYFCRTQGIDKIVIHIKDENNE